MNLMFLLWAACAPGTDLRAPDKSLWPFAAPSPKSALWGIYLEQGNGSYGIGMLVLAEGEVTCDDLTDDAQEVLYGDGLAEDGTGLLVFFLKDGDAGLPWEGSYLGGADYAYAYEGEDTYRGLLLAPYNEGQIFFANGADGWGKISGYGASTVVGDLDTDLMGGTFVAENCGDLGVDY